LSRVSFFARSKKLQLKLFSQIGSQVFSMQNNKTRVKRLEQLAFTALYEDIVRQLAPILYYRSANDEDYAENKIKQTKVVDTIREKLCHPPYRRVRASFIEEYLKHQKTIRWSHLSHCCPDVHLFLDW
jgi:hypothetical protein